ncbi:MAG: hypothetical protein LBH40_00730 [Alphaproteobacteria bacterium]|jgi:hypothetical protein|nr:hypothetical protein [Alphaproteobacteria bacterium]
MQARNFPQATSLAINTEETFITDDGTDTKKNEVDKILNIYNFMIGSCVVLNETDDTVYDENEFREITYLRVNTKVKDPKVIAIKVQMLGRSEEIGTAGLYFLRLSDGYISYSSSGKTTSFMADPLLYENDRTKDSVFINVLEINKTDKTAIFNLDVPEFFDQLATYRSSTLLATILDGDYGDFLFTPIETALYLYNENRYKEGATGILSNATVDQETGKPVSADVNIKQNITLEDISFGEKIYETFPAGGLYIETLDNYPKLKARFLEHNIKKKKKTLETKDFYLGYSNIYRDSFYEEEEHSHKVKTVFRDDVFWNSVNNIILRDKGKYYPFTIAPVNSSDSGIPHISFWLKFGESEATSIKKDETTVCPSYHSNLYIIAKVEFK